MLATKAEYELAPQTSYKRNLNGTEKKQTKVKGKKQTNRSARVKRPLQETAAVTEYHGDNFPVLRLSAFFEILVPEACGTTSKTLTFLRGNRKSCLERRGKRKEEGEGNVTCMTRTKQHLRLGASEV